MDTVNSLNKEMLEDISYSLDRFCFKQRKEYWRLLIDLPLLPKELYRYNKIDVEKLAFEGTKKRSPSMKLLQDFQSKHMELAYFKSLLKAVGCQDALDCFQEPSKHYVWMCIVKAVVSVGWIPVLNLLLVRLQQSSVVL